MWEFGPFAQQAFGFNFQFGKEGIHFNLAKNSVQFDAIRWVQLEI